MSIQTVGDEFLYVEPKSHVGVELLVVLPVYNESATIASTLDAVLRFAADRSEVRFVIVDDGSTDDTVHLTRSILAGADPRASARVRVMPLGANAGKGAAIRNAFDRLLRTRPRAVMFMDGDLAYDLDHIESMIEALRSSDVVIGSRHESPEERRNTKRLRRIMGAAFNRVVRTSLSLPFIDTQAGIKGFRAEAAQRIFTRQTLDGFAFDAEVLFVARRLGLRVGEIPARVSRAHRKKPSKVNLVGDSMRMLGDVVKIRWNQVRGRYR